MRPSPRQLRKIFRCDVDKGELFWNLRPESMFPGARSKWRCKIWNTRYSGKRAGHLLTSGRNAGYRTVRIFNISYLEHHIIWAIAKGRWPKQLDHKNGKENGNGIGNLRKATNSQNAQNSKKRSDNKSGFKGVSWDKINRKWVSRIRNPKLGKCENLGRFDSKIRAAAAYRNRSSELFGEFARAA